MKHNAKTNFKTTNTCRATHYNILIDVINVKCVTLGNLKKKLQ